MSDLISRQNVIDVFEILADKMSDEGKTVMAQAVAVLKDLQSAEPKRKGKWIDTRCKKIYKCSKCGNYLDFDGVNAGRGDANFCPNCGAKME